MLKSALFGLAALGLMAGAACAQSKMDCGKAYKNVWPKLEHERHANISAQQLVDMKRLALRAYDACQAGDEQDAKVFFARVSDLTNEWGTETSTGPYNPNLPR
jgi:hypothetical protein